MSLYLTSVHNLSSERFSQLVKMLVFHIQCLKPSPATSYYDFIKREESTG